MTIVEVSTGKSIAVEIVPFENIDYKRIDSRRYFFDWSAEKESEVYKLRILGNEDILGLISIENIPEEWRIHIRLLTVSKENRGKEKQYDRIAGNLIAFVAKTALEAYAELACVSLKPKSKLAKHYIEKYNMSITGLSLSIEMPDILSLVNFYYHE